MNKRVAAELVSQYLNGRIGGRAQKEGMRDLFAHDREVDTLLATVDRLVPALRPIEPDPIFLEELRAKLDKWQPEGRPETSISWRKLIIPVAAACSVVSAAALVLLIGRLRSTGGRVERPFPTFSAG